MQLKCLDEYNQAYEAIGYAEKLYSKNRITEEEFIDIKNKLEQSSCPSEFIEHSIDFLLKELENKISYKPEPPKPRIVKG